MNISFTPGAKKHFHKSVIDAKEKQAIEAVFERALKYYSGIKKVSIGLTASPQRQIEAFICLY